MNLLETHDPGIFFSGTLGLEPDNGGWIPRRFTQRQLREHAGVGENRRIRTECAVGVVVRLATDSPWLELAFDCLGGARAYLGVDVDVDGRTFPAFHADHFEGAFRQRVFDAAGAPGRLRRIEVWLPDATVVRLREINIAAGGTAEPLPPPPVSLLCLGDSITQGMHTVSPSTTYPALLARLLGAGVLNQGIGGHVFDAASLDDTPGFEPGLVTVAYGTNDWSRGIGEAEIRTNAAAYAGRIRELFPAAPITVVSPLWRDTGGAPKGGGLTLDAFGRVIREAVADLPGTTVVDGYDLVPPDARYFVDGIHPNELGFMHFAVNLHRRLPLPGNQKGNQQ